MKLESTVLRARKSTSEQTISEGILAIQKIVE